MLSNCKFWIITDTDQNDCYVLISVDAALEDVFASVCSNHKAYSNEKKKTMGKCDFTHIPHGHNGIEERLGMISN